MTITPAPDAQPRRDAVQPSWGVSASFMRLCTAAQEHLEAVCSAVWSIPLNSTQGLEIGSTSWPHKQESEQESKWECWGSKGVDVPTGVLGMRVEQMQGAVRQMGKEM
jgi:hypothetical protein